MDDASLRDFNKVEGTYVADALERSLLLLADMAGMVRFSTFVALLAFVP